MLHEFPKGERSFRQNKLSNFIQTYETLASLFIMALTFLTQCRCSCVLMIEFYVS